MCSRVYSDKKGEMKLAGPTLCTIIRDGILTKDSVELFIDNINMNARVESIEDIWKAKYNCFDIQMNTKVQSFFEAGRLFCVGDDVDLTTIGVEFRGRMEVRFVTRPDGLAYFKQHGVYAPHTNKAIATRENAVHSRWPLYRPRLVA